MKWYNRHAILAISCLLVVLLLYCLSSWTSPQTKDSRVKVSVKSHKMTVLRISRQRHSQLKYLYPLPERVVSGVKLFVLFVGYPRSGHSIIGSLLDAHPNVVLAHELNVFDWIQENSNYSKTQLFNELFMNSYNNTVSGVRSQNKKGYNLTLGNSWQGRYRNKINIIGDKCGGKVSILYGSHPDAFQQLHARLKQVISIPIHFIHCVRNPYDIISTALLYKIKKEDNRKDLINKLRSDSRSWNHTGPPNQLKNDSTLIARATRHFSFADSVLSLSKSLTDPILEIHNYELVSKPKQTIQKLCAFLGMRCSSDYVNTCASKVFPELSRTRFTVNWSEAAKKMVQDRIQKYPFFQRYSYDSEI